MGLHVQSLDRSVEFYTSVLGFQLAFRWRPKADYIAKLTGEAGYQLEAAVMRIADAHVALELLEYQHRRDSPARAADAVPGTAHLALGVRDIDEMYARLIEHCVRTTSAPVTSTIGPLANGRILLAFDPTRSGWNSSSLGAGCTNTRSRRTSRTTPEPAQLGPTASCGRHRR